MDEPRVLRRVFQVGYVLMCVGIGGSVAWSVTAEGLGTPAPTAAPIAAPADVTPDGAVGRQCVQRLRGLYDDLHARARVAFDAAVEDAAESEAAWRRWSNGFRAELRALRSGCRLETEAMRPVEQLASDVERVHLAYTTGLRGFVEVGRKPVVRLRAAWQALPPGGAH